jgi:ATP-binding cassette subfamily B protein
VEIKRMYGNSAMHLCYGECNKKTIFRFSNDVLSMCEAASHYINNIKNGEDKNEQYGILESVYNRRHTTCIKCGRILRSPGAKCLNCSSKNKILIKFSKHLAPQKYILLFSLILSAIVTAVNLLPPYLTKMLVDDVIKNSDRKKLIMVVLLLLCAHFTHYLLAAIKNYMLRISGHKILLSLRNEVYEKAQYLPMSFYDKTSTGAVINRINSDTNTLQSFMMRVTQEVIVQLFTLIGIVIIMLFLDWRLTLLSLFPVPFVAFVARKFSKKILPYYMRIWRRNSAVSGLLSDTIPGVRVIKSFVGEKNAVDNFKDHTDEWFKVDKDGAKIIVTFPQVISFFVTCGSLLIWGVGGSQVINGTGISLGLLMSFISYTSMFYGPVNFFANLSDTYQSAIAAAERIFDIIDAEPERDFGKGNIPATTVKGKIEFKNINFSYDKAKKILENVSLTIEEGDVVGIVGTTGSGKSTLVNLFLRYYDSYDGEILLDGQNIQDIDMQWFRSQIGYVQQEPVLFHDTIYNNISFNSPEFTPEQVINAADIAHAHDFIVRQPDCYDSVLGERGVGLSGGEKQRLSIARAVLKNPSILVFDEATASVDSETEHHIQSAIEQLINGRTTIMIAHRLSTLSLANKIVVLDNGKIIECGSPDELMKKKGKYYKLVEIQSMSDKIRASKQEERFE